MVAPSQNQGSCCLVLLLGPLSGMTNHETLQQISRGYRLPRPAVCPAEVYVLMIECWKASPEERPTFATLREKLNAINRRLHLGLT